MRSCETLAHLGDWASLFRPYMFHEVYVRERLPIRLWWSSSIMTLLPQFLKSEKKEDISYSAVDASSGHNESETNLPRYLQASQVPGWPAAPERVGNMKLWVLADILLVMLPIAFISKITGPFTDESILTKTQFLLFSRTDWMERRPPSMETISNKLYCLVRPCFLWHLLRLGDVV